MPRAGIALLLAALLAASGVLAFDRVAPSSPQSVAAQRVGGAESQVQLWLPLLSRHALLGELSGRIGARLTQHESDEWEPVVSPDGRWIAYLTRPVGPPTADGQARLRVMATDGSCDETLALPPFADLDLPAWDATRGNDGTKEALRLLFAGQHAAQGARLQWDLFRVSLNVPDDGCPRVILTAAPGHATVRQDVEGRLINLTATPDLDEGRLSLSPDGRWLAFDQAEPDAEDWNIAVLDLSRGTRRVLTSHPARDRKPSFSPDGRHIVFRSEQSGNSQIFRIDLDGGGLARLTFTLGNDGYPSYAPDGRHILFESDKGGTKGLYLMDAWGRGRQVLLSDDRLRFATPSWHPNGVDILFTAGAADVSLDLHRMRLPVLAGP